MKSPLDEAILAAQPFDMTGWTKIDEVPFDFERRRVSVLVEHDAERRLIVKGAPEDLLRLSGRYEDADGSGAAARRRRRGAAFEATLRRARRAGVPRAGHRQPRGRRRSHATAAIDRREATWSSPASPSSSIRRRQAPGRRSRRWRRAGVAVKVLTGDNELVTRHVFAEIGVPVTGVLTGDALTQLTDEALIGQLPRVNLFCRVNPQQKHRILLALKRLGHVVGFMGDGINDAPALHAADVGISVDGAADVARAAADLILLEHDLSVVREARASHGRAHRPERHRNTS